MIALLLEERKGGDEVVDAWEGGRRRFGWIRDAFAGTGREES